MSKRSRNLEQNMAGYVFKRIARVCGVTLFIFIVAFIIFAVLFKFTVLDKYNVNLKECYEEATEDVSESTEESMIIGGSSFIYASDGTQLSELSSSDSCIYLTYDEIPENVVNAFVSVEDQSFWSNNGIDIKGIARICLKYFISQGDDVSGASTITQQLARTVFLTQEVSLERKVKEIFISLQLTQKYTKEQIMEYYVNDACFGNALYGIEAASEAYFGVEASELTLSQTAYLCALPNRPTYFNPYENPDRALDRRDKILNDMYDCGYITEAQLSEALNEKITICDQESGEDEFYNYETTYAVNCAVEYLMKLDGFDFKYEFVSDDVYDEYEDDYAEAYDEAKNKLYTGSYKIYTSIDEDAQQELQTVLDDNLSFNSETDSDTGIYTLQGAITVIDNDSGNVVAIIGGRSQDELSGIYSLNRAYQSYRQPGSTIKPLAVYTPALMAGYTADSQLEDISVTEANKTGTDISTLSGTSMTLRDAVVNSVNGCAYQLFYNISPDYGLGFITEMKFDKIVPEDFTLSAALGGLTYGVTTVQMASGYATLVNSGEYREPTCITSIKDASGTELYSAEDSTSVYDADACTEMISILKGVLTDGTASSMGWSDSSDIAAAGKTGTTNESKDGWFCGMTPYYTISVWVGYDTPKELSTLYGGTYPASIWKDAMLSMTDGMSAIDFDGTYTYESTTQEDTTTDEESLTNRLSASE